MDRDVIREALSGVARYRGKNILFLSSGVGEVDLIDLEFLIADLLLLQKGGMQVALIDNNGSLPEDAKASKLRIFPANSWEEVLELSVTLQAAKICLWCGSDSIYSEGKPLDTISATEAERIATRDEITSKEVRAVLAFAAKACTRGVPRVHIFNAHRHESLFEELFTERGAGTMIHGGFLSENHKQVRRAGRDDKLGLISLLHNQIRNHRSVTYVTQHLEEFRIFSVDGNIHGCARVLAEGSAVEIRSLAHSSRFNSSETLEMLLKTVLAEAEEMRASSVIIPIREIPALMAIQVWFSRLGFKKTNLGGTDVWIKSFVH